MGFREMVLPSRWFERRLRAVRDLVFLVGADLIPKARRIRVRFALSTEERADFLHHLRTLVEGLPIAAQLDWDVAEAENASQTPREPADYTVQAIQSTPYAHAASPDRHSTAESGIILQGWKCPVSGSIPARLPHVGIWQRKRNLSLPHLTLQGHSNVRFHTPLPGPRKNACFGNGYQNLSPNPKVPFDRTSVK